MQEETDGKLKYGFSNQPRQDIKVTVNLTYIEAVKQKDTSFVKLEYPMDMKLGEAIRKFGGTTVIHFSLRVATNPDIAVFVVKGDAILEGSTEQIQRVTIPEKNAPPPIWMTIYRESLLTVTLLSQMVGIPPPPS